MGGTGIIVDDKKSVTWVNSPLNKLKGISAIFLIFCTFITHALLPSVPLNQYRMNCYGAQDGLPQNSITDIVINTDGQLLIATYSGLVAFDGHRFSQYIPGTTIDFPAVEAFSLGVNQQGAIWVGTTSSGLYRIEGKNIDNWQLDNGLQAQIIYKILIADDGVLLNNGGHTIFLDDQNQLSYLNETDDHGIFLQTFQNINKRLLITQTQESNTHALAVSSHDLINEHFTNQGNTDGKHYLAENGKVYTIQNGVKTLLIDQLIENTPVSITKLMLDRKNNLWIATATNGLFRYSDLGIESFSNLPNNRLSSIVEDEDGAIWVGTSGGLCMLKVGAIRNIGMYQGLENENIHALGIDSSDNVYLIPYEKTSNITYINEQKILNTQLSLPNDPDGVVINAIKQEQGKIWVATSKNISQLIDNTLEPLIDLKNGIKAFLVKDNVFWYQEGKHLIKNKDNKKTIITLDQENPIDIKAMSFALNGDILIAENRHLYRVKDDQAEKINIPIEAASCIYQFRADEIWACGGGLWLQTPQRNYHFSKEHQLTSVTNGHIHDVITDKYGHIWAISNSGLFRVLRQDIDHIKSGSVDTISFIKFAEKDGMRSSEFNGSSSGAVITSNGQLWFASQGGVVEVDPDLTLFHSGKQLKPFIEKMFIGDDLIAPKQWQHIAPNPKIIQMHFSAAFLSDAQNVSFRYKLTPKQPEWKAGKIAHFPELAPGQYQLQLQARYYHNEWSSALVQDFHILPSWYQTWWFRIIASIVTLTVLFGLPIWRIQRLKAHEKMLKEQVAQRTKSLIIANEKLDQMTRLDELTGIANRRDFISKIEKLCKDPENTICLALIDIDDFKAYNDCYGHLKGDECLIQVAEVLHEHSSNNSLVARFGGEEFVILFYDHDIQSASKIIKNIYDALLIKNIPHEHSSASPRISLSTGLVMRKLHERVEKVIDRADMAMYKAKSNGKNQLIIEH